jgi:hypothetical protein
MITSRLQVLGTVSTYQVMYKARLDFSISRGLSPSSTPQSFKLHLYHSITYDKHRSYEVPVYYCCIVR